MQSLTIPTGPRNPSGATEADILAALRGVAGARRLTFRFELFTSANVKIGDLDQVEEATVELDWLADIKRKATFKIRDTGGIDYLSNRIKPWVRLHLSPTVSLVPADVEVTVRAWGAQGGGTAGGLGGYAEGTFTLPAGTILNVRASGQGAAPTSQTGQTDPGAGNPGGFNGGGGGGYYFDDFNDIGNLQMGGSGGGTSDVRWGGDTLAERRVVAAGGGGASTHGSGSGGDGGGASGEAGGSGPNTGAQGGAGGTDSAAGAGGTTGSGSNGEDGDLGVGGDGGVWITFGNNGGGPGGGGGGLFGGGGGKSGSGFGEAGGGGGGSGFVAEDATDTDLLSGEREGDGRVEIEVDGSTTVFTFTGAEDTYTVPGGTVAVVTTGSFVEWPQGVFLLSTPTRQADENGTVTRAVEGYDAGQVFLDDKVTDRHTVLVGSNIITAVSTLLGSIPKNVTPAPLTLSSSLEWMPGTPKLEIINELLEAANYDSLWFDEDGLAIVRPYVSPVDRPSGYTYADDEVSVLNPKVAQQLDLFDVPNRWVLVVSDPDWPYIRSVFTNNDPSSPTSTVRRGRTITLYDDQQYAADQATLDGKAARMAFEHSQVYEQVEFETALFPIHSGNDVFRVEYGPLAITGKFNETRWSMTLRAGEPMRHTARRVVSVA